MSAAPSVRVWMGLRFRAAADRLREREFWLVQAAVAVVTVLHFGVELLERSGQASFAELYHLAVIAYLVPVVYGGLRYGLTGGVCTGLWIVVLTIPNLFIFHRNDGGDVLGLGDRDLDRWLAH